MKLRLTKIYRQNKGRHVQARVTLVKNFDSYQFLEKQNELLGPKLLHFQLMFCKSNLILGVPKLFGLDSKKIQYILNFTFWTCPKIFDTPKMIWNFKNIDWEFRSFGHQTHFSHIISDWHDQIKQLTYDQINSHWAVFYFIIDSLIS